MEIETIAINASITIFSLGLLIISLISYKKYKNQKLIFITLILIVLLVKGILLSITLFNQEISSINQILYGPYIGFFDLIILILLFLATLKR